MATKKINVELIDRSESEGKMRTPYRIMLELIKKHHKHLKDAHIALAWRYGWKEDDDGRLILGQAKKASDLDRLLHEYDFIILLNHEAWNAANFSEDQMRALLDHELCHCERKMDVDGQQEDEDGRAVWRIRKHDMEEFSDVIKRNGMWKKDLVDFAAIAIDKAEHPLTSGKADLEIAI